MELIWKSRRQVTNPRLNPLYTGGERRGERLDREHRATAAVAEREKKTKQANTFSVVWDTMRTEISVKLALS